MCQSLGKKDFSKKGLAAMCVYDALYCAELAKRQANGLEGVESLTPLVEKAKSIAEASEMLLLKRSELEALAEQVKGKYSSWGSYACFSSSQF